MNSKLISYLQLFRAPNVFTAIADVAMGYLVTARSVERPIELGLVVVSTMLLYTAGMVLNDVFDIEVDRVERPERPLPSGRIPLPRARMLGFVMLVLGVLTAGVAGWFFTSVPPWNWRAGAVGLLLAIAIVAYDAWAKRFAAGAMVMGACRFLNILLGMSLHASVEAGRFGLVGFGLSHLMIAGGIGLFIVGVTVFARGEASVSSRKRLVLGVVIMALGIFLLAAFPGLDPEAFSYRLDPRNVWPAAMLLISIWILRRCLAAVSRPEPMYVQAAVKFCLVSLIILDATLCLMLNSSGYALGVLALLIPTLTLGRWVYST